MANMRTSILGLVSAIGGVLIAWSPTAHPWVATLGGVLVAIGSGGGLALAADARPAPAPEAKP
jgi:hypothetical protein